MIENLAMSMEEACTTLNKFFAVSHGADKNQEIKEFINKVLNLEGVE